MRHVRTALVAAGALCLAAPLARATPSRTQSMGDMGRFIDDDSNVLVYPGELPKFTHFTYIDLGGPAALAYQGGTPKGGTIGLNNPFGEVQTRDLNGGAFLRLGEGLSLGLVTSSYNANDVKNFFNAASAHGNPANKGGFDDIAGQVALRRYDLIGAYGDKSMGFGLRLGIGTQGDTYEPGADEKITGTDTKRSTDTRSLSEIKLAVGASGSQADGTSWDGAVDYTHHGVTYQKNAKDAFDGGGGNSFGVNGRVRLPVTRFWDIIPALGYRFSQFGMDEFQSVPVYGAGDASKIAALPDNEDNLHTYTTHTLDLGAAGALRASKTASFYVAAGVLYQRSDYFMDGQKKVGGKTQHPQYEETGSIASLPYLRFGFEALVADWIKFRGGVEKFVWSTTEEVFTTDGEHDVVKSTSRSVPSGEMPDFQAYLGAGVNLNGFLVDLVLDKDFLKRGPAFISGKPGDLAVRASFGYKF